MKDIELQSFIEDLEETILRLHTWFRNIEEKYDQYRWSKKFFRKGRVKYIGKKRREELESFLEYRYYQGKFYAYYYVLESLGSDVPKVLTRLRGIISPKHNTLMETKAHYSKIKGHFPTNEYLEYKKAKL